MRPELRGGGRAACGIGIVVRAGRLETEVGRAEQEGKPLLMMSEIDLRCGLVRSDRIGVELDPAATNPR